MRIINHIINPNNSDLILFIQKFLLYLTLKREENLDCSNVLTEEFKVEHYVDTNIHLCKNMEN